MKINETLRMVILGGIFGVLFIPFIVADSQFFPFITGKGFVFRIGVEILFVLWIILALRDRAYLPKFSWITGTILIFLGVIGLADILGENPYKSFWSNYERMEGFISLIHFLLYYLVVSSMLKTAKLWNIFLNVSVVASMVMVFYGFLQLSGKLVINQGGVRVDGTFGNATYLAVYMLFNMFFAAFLFARAKGNIYLKSAYAAAFVLQGVILYYTATRGTILGLIGGVIVSALLLALFAKGNKKARISGVVVLAVVLSLVGGFLAIQKTDFVRESQTLSRFAELDTDGIKSQGRYFVWPMAWEGFKERPILGWGQENFNHVFNKYYDPRMYRHEQWFDRTHNIFLDWLVVGGILGFLSYLVLYGALMFYLWRGKNGFSLVDKAVITGLVSAYLFQNIFIFDNLISYVMFFSLLAFVHAMSTEDRAPIRWVSKLSSNKVVGERVIVPVVLVALVLSLYFVNTKPILANRALIKAINLKNTTPVKSLEDMKKVFSYNTFGSSEAREQFLGLVPVFTSEAVPAEVRNDFISLAESELKKQVDATPLDTRYLMFTGSVLSQIGKQDEAISYFERAIETSPTKQSLYFALGAAYIAKGKSEYPKAIEIFKKAYELDTSHPEAAFIYGLGGIYIGDKALVSEMLGKTDPNELVMDERVLSAYYMIADYRSVTNILEDRVKLNPNNTESRFRLAAVYFQVGEKAKSIEQLRKAVEIDPNLKAQAEYIIGEIQAGRNPLN